MSGYEKFSGNNSPSAPPPPYGSHQQPNFVPMHAQPGPQTNIQMPPMISHVQVRRDSPRECCCCCCTCPFWVCGLFFLLLIGVPMIIGFTSKH